MAPSLLWVWPRARSLLPAPRLAHRTAPLCARDLPPRRPIMHGTYGYVFFVPISCWDHRAVSVAGVVQRGEARSARHRTLSYPPRGVPQHRPAATIPVTERPAPGLKWMANTINMRSAALKRCGRCAIYDARMRESERTRGRATHKLPRAPFGACGFARSRQHRWAMRRLEQENNLMHYAS